MQKKIIIIGATSGIGRKLAENYAEKGFTVGISGRRIELLKEIGQQFPGQIVYECFDITANENIDHLERLINKSGGLDILIISAGIGEPSKDLSWAIDKKTINTNVNGFAEIANRAFNFFVHQGYGHLAAISSVGANRGGSRASSYNASKAFQSNFLEGLAIKAKNINKEITVTCIEPGFLETKKLNTKNLFWVIPVDKAARQIMKAIDKKKRKVYISRRWWLIAKMMKWMPWWIYSKIG